MNVTRRIVLTEPVDGDGGEWRWRDVVTREVGRCRFIEVGLEPGDELVVELRYQHGAWKVVRMVERPQRAFASLASNHEVRVGETWWNRKPRPATARR